VTVRELIRVLKNVNQDALVLQLEGLSSVYFSETENVRLQPMFTMEGLPAPNAHWNGCYIDSNYHRVVQTYLRDGSSMAQIQAVVLSVRSANAGDPQSVTDPSEERQQKSENEK
jgi:hypothetical protein